MKLIDISPDFLNEDLALKICRNKELKRKYSRKYFWSVIQLNFHINLIQ